jgi:hypothetical protein
MEKNEFTFRIDAFTPDTIPMARLAEYLAGLAELVGYKDSTHFVCIDAGSARLISRVEDQDAPSVRQRLASADGVDAEPAAAKAFKILDDMLANDNAIGDVSDSEGAIVIAFPGRTRQKPLAFPAFRQEGSLDGQILSVGGKDRTAHVILRDGAVTYSNIELSHDLARAMSVHLYGAKVRLFGQGRWERHPDGAWKLLKFSVDRFEPLDNTPLSQVLGQIRTTPGNQLMTHDAVYDDLMSLRLGEGGVH